MRPKMERFVLLPFSIGCISESSVAVGIHHNARSESEPISSPRSKRKKEEDGEEEVGGETPLEESLKNSQSFIAKPNIGVGFHRLYKGFKNFSQLFVYKEETDEMEMSMEIGCPKDVKHVSHIGCDTNSLIAWETLIASNDDHLSNPNHLSSFLAHSI